MDQSKGDMTVKEAGRRGGEAVKRIYGADYHSRVARGEKIKDKQ